MKRVLLVVILIIISRQCIPLARIQAKKNTLTNLEKIKDLNELCQVLESSKPYLDDVVPKKVFIKTKEEIKNNTKYG